MPATATPVKTASQRFLADQGVQRALACLDEQWANHPRVVSDVRDAAGRQYVDLVLEGGGVLGIALVGYTYALERVGIRFLHLGGTSAGAIHALVLAAAGTKDEAKSEAVLDVLAETSLESFLDGDRRARSLTHALAGGAGTWRLGWHAFRARNTLREHLGLHPGVVFTEWLESTLAGFDVRTLADLEARLCASPEGLDAREAGCRLGIVSAEIRTETKVVFPEMAELFWDDPASVSPAHFVRASMSIPGFFWPFRVGSIPDGEAATVAWSHHAGYRGTLPTECLFVDGGILSNFPIDLFHVRGVPSAPTLGAKLDLDRTAPREIGGVPAYLGAILDAARNNLDYDFIRRNPDYSQLVTAIPTTPHHWLNFSLDWEAKIDLFRRGVEAATDFLAQFDWEGYKNLRAQAIELT